MCIRDRVVELLHETYLRLLLYRFVSGTVLTHAERIVAPHIFHRKLHKSRHAHCRFHVVREHKECAARTYETAVYRDAVHNHCHGKLAHTGMQKRPDEITVCKGMSMLEKTVSLI